MKKFLDSDWQRGEQFYFKLHCMQCKLTKQEQNWKRVRDPTWHRALAVHVNFHLFSSFLHFELKIVCDFNN